MGKCRSSESLSSQLAAIAWQPVDCFVVVIWLEIPFAVFLGRKILLHGASDRSAEQSTWAQHLVGLHALAMVSILSVVMLLGVATIHRQKPRRLFMNIALSAGVLVVIVYVVSCLAPAMTTIQRLG